jgi:hypothetical protein
MLTVFQFWPIKQVGNCVKIEDMFPDGNSDSRLTLNKDTVKLVITVMHYVKRRNATCQVRFYLVCCRKYTVG